MRYSHFPFAAQNRRTFIKGIFSGTAGIAASSALPAKTISIEDRNPGNSTVSFVTGSDRRDMVYQALKPFEKEIKRDIRDKQVIIKPNNVFDSHPLCATHPDAMRGVLDFLKPIYNKQILIAESTTSPKGTMVTFEEYKYLPLAQEYSVKLIDLNTSTATTQWIIDKSHHPLGVRIIDTFLDPNNYFISVTRLKSHDTVVATLSIKNMVMASPLHEYNVQNDKKFMHQGPKETNWNLFQLASMVNPQLSVLDGVEGMEGNGPVGGTSVDHGVVLAGTDFVAVDSIGAQLMGLDLADIGYITYCSDAGYGQGDRSKIKIDGPDPSKYVIKYKLHDNIETQMKWKET